MIIVQKYKGDIDYNSIRLYVQYVIRWHNSIRGYYPVGNLNTQTDATDST